MTGRIWAWLVDPANWSGEDGIPHRVLQHLGYSVLVLAIAAAIAVPVGIWVGHTGRGRSLITLANSLRAVPTLGLLFAVAMWLQPHLNGDAAFLVPCVVALVLLAIPPILTGAYGGIESVDPAARDAAAGLGMRPSQVVLRVELPCAVPLLVSGLRSAALQVVATATIAAYVGLGGLGRYLVDGIATNDYPRTGGGAVVVAVVALAVDLLGAAIQARLVSPGLSHRYPGTRRTLGALRSRTTQDTGRIPAGQQTAGSPAADL